MLRLLSKLGADLSARRADGSVPAQWAASAGHLEVVRLLGELGADVTTADNTGVTPLAVASQQGRVHVVRALSELRADVNIAANSAPDREDGMTPILFATEGSLRSNPQGHLEVVLRSEVNSELNFSPNFEGLVLGCIDADFCK